MRCKLLFSSPMPSTAELEEYYQGFLFKEPRKNEINHQKKRRNIEVTKLFGVYNKIIDRKYKRFLDFGGGTGIVYSTAYDLGFDTFYYDLDRKSIEFTIKHFDLKPEKIITDITTSELKFDYIFSDNVIEHVTNPINFIRNLINHLENGGTLVIKTPHGGNTETFFNPKLTIVGYFLPSLKYNSILKSIKALFTRFWHCDPPRHLYSFSKKNLCQLMSAFDKSEINYEILYYKIPWYENTVTNFFFNKFSRLSWGRQVLFTFIIIPIVFTETLLQVTKRLLLLMGILTPGGIILRIKKFNNTSTLNQNY
jgi:2-polyprenyl-3-methyl-5-hydroxy-6-metoxy-1,4-benzoquinol methylase